MALENDLKRQMKLQILCIVHVHKGYMKFGFYPGYEIVPAKEVLLANGEEPGYALFAKIKQIFMTAKHHNLEI